jgi:hypothetical protein
MDQAAKFYEPYKNQFALLAMGNHETSVLRHCDLNLTKWLAERLNVDSTRQTQVGGYNGFVKFLFHITATMRQSKLLYFTHGAGGNSPVTKGVIKTARRAVYLPDADVVLSGHSHESWVVPIARRRVTEAGRMRLDECLHVQIPSYKNEPMLSGWEAEKEFAPQTCGAYWLIFYRKGTDIKIEARAVRD